MNDLFNRKFSTYRTYIDPQSILNGIPNPPIDHRMVTPPQPPSIYVGMRVKLRMSNGNLPDFAGLS